MKYLEFDFTLNFLSMLSIPIPPFYLLGVWGWGVFFKRYPP